ncbi:hypothetical protein [Paenibacillus pabuli]|uniref:hypothetical protein n=1 Tax=Paenibacillus pabuli TaxID=1472 RepID=UPI001FFE99FF|nr:hypothetical protein [Paenibacillus pabuli]UPK45937.1 hypothetical protein KET34_11005 [Paenibacillus pabuli]
MYDWKGFDPKNPPQVGKTYLVYVPGNETGEYMTAEFYNYDCETCFWCVLTGSEVQGVTHYSEINTNVSPLINRSGDHVFLRGNNAKETIGLALLHLEADVRQEGRSKGFEDCTTYWKGEIEKIRDFGGPPRAQLSRILNLFNLEPKEEEQS